MTLTKDQQAAIAAKVNGMTLPSGLGDEHSACSVAAINLALTGRLTDEIPACMSAVIGYWVIQAQDAMPNDTRNSKAWKSLLPLAAGTGRDHEPERLALIMDWLFDIVLPYVQPIADSGGYGKEWRAMCELRTGEAARMAEEAARYDAKPSPAGDAAWDAAAAVEAAAKAAGRPVWATFHVACHAACSAVLSAKASGDQEKAWAHFDPCGLLQKLVEVGK